MAPYPLAIGQGAAPQFSSGLLPSASMLGPSLSLTSSVPTPTLRQLHDLPARSFHHLTIFAYLAIGFIILAVTTVLTYIIYSCYHTAKGRMDTNLVPSFTPSPIRDVSADARAEAGEENLFGDADGGKVHTVFQPRGMSGGIGAMASMSDRVAEAGEKARRSSAKFGQTVVLEMKGLGLRGRQRINSESLHNMASYPNNSQVTLSDAGTEASSGSESDAYYLTSPPMAHTSLERSAPYILPFHLPPPPPSPTPAHKQNVERQYGRQQSPVSPSPSFCTIACSPQPITPRLKSPAVGVGGNSATWSGQTVFGSEHSQSNIGKDKAKATPTAQVDDSKDSGKDENEKGHDVQFDSNNIRFVSPLNPFTTPAAASIWSDSKLSPVNGSIITAVSLASPMPDTPLIEGGSFVNTLTSALKTPPSSGLKSSASPSKLDSNRRGYSDKENGRSIGRRKGTLRTTDRPNIMSSSANPNSSRA